MVDLLINRAMLPHLQTSRVQNDIRVAVFHFVKRNLDPCFQYAFPSTSKAFDRFHSHWGLHHWHGELAASPR